MAPTKATLTIAACAVLASSDAFMIPGARSGVSMTADKPTKAAAPLNGKSAAAAVLAAGVFLQGAICTPVDAAGFSNQGSQPNVGLFSKDAKSAVRDASNQAKRAASDIGNSNNQGSRALDQAKIAGDALKEGLSSAGSSGNAVGDAANSAKQAGNKAKQAASNLGSSNTVSANNIGDEVKSTVKSATSAVSSTADDATNSKAVPNTWSSGGSKNDVVASAKGAAQQAKGAAKSAGSKFGGAGSSSGGNIGGIENFSANKGGSRALDEAKVAGQAFQDTVGGNNQAGNAVNDAANTAVNKAQGAAGQAKRAASNFGSSNTLSLNFGKPQQNKNAGDLNPRNAPTIADGLKEAGQGAVRNADKASEIAGSNANKVSNAGGEFGESLSSAGSTLKGKAQQAGDAMATKDAFGNENKPNFGSSNTLSLNFGKPQQNKNAGDLNPRNAPTIKDGLKTASKGAARNADKAQEIVKNNAGNVPNAAEDLGDAVARASNSVQGEAKQGVNNLGTAKGF